MIGIETLRVLLAEDEAALRAVIRETLEEAGFLVIAVGDGTSALDVLRSEAVVDVLLSDIRMPGLNGYQVAEACLTLRPKTGVMLMTGYSDEEIPARLQEAAVPVIRKPFNFAELAGSVGKVAASR